MISKVRGRVVSVFIFFFPKNPLTSPPPSSILALCHRNPTNISYNTYIMMLAYSYIYIYVYTDIYIADIKRITFPNHIW